MATAWAEEGAEAGQEDLKLALQQTAVFPQAWPVPFTSNANCEPVHVSKLLLGDSVEESLVRRMCQNFGL